MNFKIDGTEKELKFSIGFIRKLDSVYTADMNGVKFGMGLSMAMIQLRQYNPATLSEVIRAASRTPINLLTVDRAIEDYAEEHDGLEELFEEILDAVGKSKVTKDTLNKMETMTEMQD